MWFGDLLYDEEEELSLVDFFIALARDGKERIVSAFVDELVEPWYAARTGKQTNRTMRRQVAEQVEKALSNTTWVLTEEAAQLGEDGTDDSFSMPLQFVVGNVFPQSEASGNYNLKVVIFQKTLPANTHVLEISQFMHDFKPYKELGFADFDA